MTASRDRDQLVHTFFQEGPAELSPRVLAGIRDDVHLSPQLAPRRRWRTVTMSRPIVLFVVLGALLLALGSALLIGSGGRNAAPAPTPTSAPSPSTPAASPSLAVVPYPLADGEPWVVFAADSGGAGLVKPDGTGSHEILRGLLVRANVPAWSSDGRQIVFEGNGDQGSQVWVANADGTGARQLTPTPAGCPDQRCTEGVQPAWSPDGQSIAYISVTHNSGGFLKAALAILDVATGASTDLYSTNDSSLVRPSWSPDGGRIVLEIDHYQGTPEATPVTSSVIGVVTVDGADQAPKEITKPDDLAGFATWHPSEDLIVFRTNRFDLDSHTMQDATAPSDLYTIQPDGTHLRAVTHNTVGGVIVRAPTWTSDGRIMFSKLADAQSVELLRVIDPSGTGEASATGPVDTVGEARWRPTT
jgi:dipeptidyl aminopeptidase/acylaminoacyl peptidase